MSDDNELLPGRVLSTVESDPASPRTRPTGVELAAMTDADFDAWVHAHSDTADPASPRTAESRDLRVLAASLALGLRGLDGDRVRRFGGWRGQKTARMMRARVESRETFARLGTLEGDHAYLLSMLGTIAATDPENVEDVAVAVETAKLAIATTPERFRAAVPAPEVRETLRASMEAWYAAVAARDQKAAWRAGNEMHVAIARFLTPPLPDDERLRAALERDPDKAADLLQSALDWVEHGDFYAAAHAVRALAPHPSEPQEP